MTPTTALTPLTEEELTELEKATAGPWEWVAEDASMATLCRNGDQMEGHVLTVTICKNCSGNEAHWAWGRCYTAKAPDARLIAAAPRLLAELRRHRTPASTGVMYFTKNDPKGESLSGQAGALSEARLAEAVALYREWEYGPYDVQCALTDLRRFIGRLWALLSRPE